MNAPFNRGDFEEGDPPRRALATEVGFAGVCKCSDRPLLRDFALAVSGSGRDAVVVEGFGRIAVVVGAAATGPWSEAMGIEAWTRCGSRMASSKSFSDRFRRDSRRSCRVLSDYG